jgi:hypothetical protein
VNQLRAPVCASTPYSVFVFGRTYHFFVVAPVSHVLPYETSFRQSFSSPNTRPRTSSTEKRA